MASAVALVVVGVAVDAQRSDHVAELPPASAPPVPAPTSEAPAPSPALNRGRFLDPGLALPGAGKEVLFARSSTALYRIQLRTGAVVETPGATVAREDPVSMVAGPRQVVINEGGSGSGVVVADGRPAKPLRRPTGARSELFPGPGELLWVHQMRDSGPGSVFLVDTTGRPRSRPVSLGGAWPQADGRGNLLLSDVGGVYELSRSGTTRVSTGSVSAVGLNHYLLLTCDSRRRCAFSLYDRATRTSTRLGRTDTANLPTGTLSPDGRYAALMRWEDPNPTLEVRDLREGRSRSFPGQFSPRYGLVAASSAAWTADSRFLIALLDGQVKVLDTATGRIRSSDGRLPTFLQLALRTT